MREAAATAMVSALLAAVVLTACQRDRAAEVTSARPTIGPSGGVVEVEGARLTLPAGALTEPTEITIAATTGSGPPTYDALSPVFEFGPSGLHFAVPLTVELTYAGDGAGAVVLWSTEDGASFEELATTLGSPSRASAEVVHFSRGLVGRRRPGLPVSTVDASGSPLGDGGILVVDGAVGDDGGSDAGVADGGFSDAEAGTSGGTDAGDGGDGGTCVPYLGSCTGPGQCCSSVPCIPVDASHSVCAFAS